MCLRIVVTTTQSGSYTAGIDDFVAETGWEFVPRMRRSLEALKADTGAQGVVVWQDEGPILYMNGQRFFFHPNMAKNRLSQHRKHLTVDVMERLVGVRAGDECLDCTLGLGADAIVASYFAGSSGRVVGLESSPVIAPLVKWGMRAYRTGTRWLEEAICRIDVVQVNHVAYLQSQKPNSFDIVYFDPMFRHPVAESRGLSPLRLIADHRPLTLEAIEMAVRVARRRVVVKERQGSPEFNRLGIQTVLGGESSRVAYGVIDVNKL